MSWLVPWPGNMFPEGVCTVVVHNAADLAAKDMALPFGLSQPSCLACATSDVVDFRRSLKLAHGCNLR